MDSVGQSRMAALHGGRRDKLEVSPNLWAGVGLVAAARARRWSAIPKRSPQRMREYMALGIDTFILLGLPASRGVYRVRGAGDAAPAAWTHASARATISPNMGPFGETIANVALPTEKRAARA